MTDARPAIPAALERDLMLEAGYRCAVCKQTEPLQIDHIEEWSIVKAHEFSNMIVLCANCHGRKRNTSDPRHINRASLLRIKQNLMLLNGRYSDLERRLIDQFREALAADPATTPSVIISGRLQILVRNIILDGLVTPVVYPSQVHTRFPDGTIISEDSLRLTLDPAGRAFIDNLNNVT